MSTISLVAVFFCSFALTVIASIVLSRRIEQMGAWLQMSQSLLGIVAALGADAPEISSAVTALKGGEHDLGLGIVVGSNIFNLASLLGLSAMASGRVEVKRRTLYLNGGVALVVLGLSAAQLAGVLPSGWALVCIAAVMTPYITILATPSKWFWKFAAHLGMGTGPEETKADEESDARRAETPPQPSRADMLGIVPALVSIVVGSIGMVHTAVILGKHWSLPGAAVGTLILAVLTGIPNVVTAVQLAMRGRGSAVLSEALNSNTLNLIIGASLPAWILGSGRLSLGTLLSLLWLAGMTAAALIMSFFRGGLGRKDGALLISLYAIFVVVFLWKF